MAKALNFNLGGTPFSLAPTKLERKKFYGWTELRVTAGDGSVCQQVGLGSDGQTIIPKGGIKIGTLKEDGSWMDRCELVAVHADGSPAEAFPSSFDSPILLDTKASQEDLLDCIVSSVYQLDGDNSEGLASAVGGNIYSFPFSYKGGYESSTAFLVAVGSSVFILVGNPTRFEMVGLDQQGVIDEPDEEIEMDEDELDFNMM